MSRCVCSLHLDGSPLEYMIRLFVRFLTISPSPSLPDTNLHAICLVGLTTHSSLRFGRSVASLSLSFFLSFFLSLSTSILSGHTESSFIRWMCQTIDANSILLNGIARNITIWLIDSTRQHQNIWMFPSNHRHDSTDYNREMWLICNLGHFLIVLVRTNMYFFLFLYI